MNLPLTETLKMGFLATRPRYDCDILPSYSLVFLVPKFGCDVCDRVLPELCPFDFVFNV